MASIKRNRGAAAAPRKKDPGPRYCVYLGPSIRGVIQYGAIIHGTISEARSSCSDIIAKHPLVRNLLVPDDELAEARVKIKSPGNALYEYHRRLVQSLKTGMQGG